MNKTHSRLVAAAGVMLAAGTMAFAQPARTPATTPAKPVAAQPAAPVKPLRERLFTRGKTKEWQFFIELGYPGKDRSTTSATSNVLYRPDLHFPNNQRILSPSAQNRLDNLFFNFEAATIVFPVPKDTAGHEMQEGTFNSGLYFDGHAAASEYKPSVAEGYHSGTRLAKWELAKMQAREMRLRIEIPVRCWGLSLNEDVAKSVDWPTNEWPVASKSTFEPLYLVDYREDLKEIAENRILVDKLLKQWLGKQDPKKLKPFELAKFLAGRTLEYMQPVRSGEIGEVGTAFYGFDLQTSGEIIKAQRGGQHDYAVLLVAVYRAAGLPARMVFGYDMSEDIDKNPKAKKNKNPQMRSWVEFCVIDPDSKEEVWVPVDLMRQRGSSSRAGDLNRPWNYFGNNDDLTYVVPIAFQPHPPANYWVRGNPAFWGWLVVPETPPLEHSLRFWAMTQNSAQKDKNKPENKPKP